MEKQFFLGVVKIIFYIFVKFLTWQYFKYHAFCVGGGGTAAPTFQFDNSHLYQGTLVRNINNLLKNKF